MKKILFILYTCCILLFPVSAQQIPSFKANDRIVFLGNSITEGGHYHSYIWLYYMTHFPELPLRIYNGGIGGDCASHMVFRFDSDIKIKKPTYLVCSFGMNDSGYVGYEEGGQLTEKVRRKPYSIVLLDEIEKAHPDVFNILLQVMDEGRLTDSYGRTVDFKNTIVIMTSNIGTRQLKEFGKGIGFAAQIRTDDKEYSRSVITKALNKSFAPEFINRLDEIITFDQLDLNALTRIIDIELKGLYSRVEHIGYKLVIDENAKKFVATKGYDVQFGARPLKRAIQNNLEDGISELILGSEMAAGDTIKVSYDKEKDIIVMTVEK